MKIRDISKLRLRDLLTARLSAIHVFVALMLFVVGFAFVAQVKAQRADPLESLHEDELVLLLDQLTAAEDQLRSESAELTGQVTKLQSAHSQDEAAREAAEKEQLQAQILGGTTPVTGPGLVITIREGETPISAQKLITVLGELRNAGAEASEINGTRVVASTYITAGRDGGVELSGKPIKPPYVWRVIGDADTIQPALEIASGASSQLRAGGATVDITRSDNIEISSVVSPPGYVYAKPVE